VARPPRELGPEDDDRENRRQLEDAERVGAAAGEEHERAELDRRDSSEGGTEGQRMPADPPDEHERQQDDAEEDEGERTEAEGQCCGADGQQTTPALERPRRAQAGRKAERSP